MYLIASFTLDGQGLRWLLGDVPFQVAITIALLAVLVAREAGRVVAGSGPPTSSRVWGAAVIPLAIAFVVVVLFRFATLAQF